MLRLNEIQTQELILSFYSLEVPTPSNAHGLLLDLHSRITTDGHGRPSGISGIVFHLATCNTNECAVLPLCFPSYCPFITMFSTLLHISCIIRSFVNRINMIRSLMNYIMPVAVPKCYLYYKFFN